jgi:GTP-binding protein
MSGLIAIVGRPNVGKSALFNRIVGRRIAIVHDQPGVTRDRISAEAEWRGRPFTLVDTGGIGLARGEKTDEALLEAALVQVQIAIDAAQVIVLVVNTQEGLVPLDREVAHRLRSSSKPVLVAVNKVDHPRFEAGVAEFAELGFERLFPVSAIHGQGIEALVDAAVELLPDPAPSAASPEPDPLTPSLSPGGGEGAGGAGSGEAPRLMAGEPVRMEPGASPAIQSPIKLAIIGRPNVGKSSIINALTKSDRVIVSPVPGTTRDAVDVPFEVETDGVRQSYILIDTAGLRKARRVDDSIEFFSVKRAEDSIARCDLAVLVLDADAGITEQDKKIGDLIVANHKACVIVVNKWDLVAEAVRQAREAESARRRRASAARGPQPLTTLAEFGAWVQEHLFFLDYAPVIFTSAASGFHLDRLLEAVRYVTAQLRQKIPTALLNRALQDAVLRRPPASSGGHFLKLYYATQIRQAPPTFVLFVNRKELLSDAYRKHLANEVRRAFGYEGCPIVLIAKPRPKTIEPRRKPKRRTRR